MRKIFSPLLLSSAFFLSFASHSALVKKNLTYTDGKEEFEGYLVFDNKFKGKRPGVLVTHDWLGLTESTRAKANRVAELGYVAFAVDVYGKGKRPKDSGEAPKFAGLYKKDRALLRNRMELGLKTLRDQPQVDATKLVATGYCFGGTAAIELARAGADLDGVVSFHGGLDSPKPEDGKNIKAAILALHGADDPYVPVKDLEAFENELRNAKVDWQLVQFGGAVHSFTDKEAGTDNSKGAAYNAKADARSWQYMKDFLNEVFAQR